MGKINLVLSVLILLIAGSSCAQSKSAVKRTHAFFYIHHKGTIKLDENGNAAEPGFYPVYKIFVETNKSVKWVGATKGTSSYNIEAWEVKEKPFKVGVSEQTGEQIIINPGKGFSLYMLTLTPINPSMVDASKSSKFKINGMSGSKQFSVLVGNFRELAIEAMPR